MKVLWLILGMAAVTYGPRLLPALFMDRFTFPGWFRRWLESIPYAALAALIFPGVLEVDPDHPEVGLIGSVVAVLISLLGLHLLWAMAGAILAAYVVGQILF